MPVELRVRDALDTIQAPPELAPRLAVTLGSGLGSVADLVAGGRSFPTEELPHWPPSTVHGHAGRLVLGRWKEVPVALLLGRVHSYEGYRPDAVTFGVRVLHALGARTMIFTNAAGAISPSLEPGDLMLATDHINLIGRFGMFSPEERRERRAGRKVARPHDAALGEALIAAGMRAGVPLRRGVLLATQGPAYETPAEIRMAALMGGDAVCMSTVNEVTLAAQLGCRAASISCLTNRASGLSPRPLSHDEVTEMAGRAAGRLRRVLDEYVTAFGHPDSAA